MEAEDVNRRPGAATINDVARAAGVSTATVSRVLNDSARVSPALALKVSQVVEQLGYRPSHAAQTLRTQRA
ncbi:Bacterial regulatory protein, LacI domain protein, partial [mine drainage metagenome]